MGSTYINRVRLQELKSLLLEAQKGPESLQEALRVQAGNHRTQQDELQTLINNLRFTLNNVFTQTGGEGSTSAAPTFKDHVFSQRTQSLLESFPSQLEQLEQGLSRVESKVSVVKRLLDTAQQAETPEGKVQQAIPERADQWESETVARCLEENQRTLGEQIKTNTRYNAVFAYTATAITISAVYLMLRATG